VKGTLDEDIRADHDESGIVKYFDLEKKCFRSFKLENMIRLEFHENVFNFGL